MNSKVALLDLATEGHPYEYDSLVIDGLIRDDYKVTFFGKEVLIKKFEDKYDKQIKIEEWSSIKNDSFVNKRINKLLNVKRVLEYVLNDDFRILHIFSPGIVLSIFLLSFLLDLKKINIVLTFHLPFFMRNKAKNSLLYIFLSKIYNLFSGLALRYLLKKGIIKQIIVHGECIKNELINNYNLKDETRINVIHYPINEKTKVTTKVSKLRKELKIPNDKKVLLAFGGTRYDKGLDILLNAIKDIKKEFLLIIAGKTIDFSADWIKNFIDKNDLENKIKLDLNYVSKNKMEEYFKVSDVIVLPYRKSFSGQSGPLNKAIKYRKFIIAADVKEIGYFIKFYDLGVTFKAEETGDLRKRVDDFLENIYDFDHYRKNANKIASMINSESFLENYLKIYYKLQTDKKGY